MLDSFLDDILGLDDGPAPSYSNTVVDGPVASSHSNSNIDDIMEIDIPEPSVTADPVEVVVPSVTIVQNMAPNISEVRKISLVSSDLTSIEVNVEFASLCKPSRPLENYKRFRKVGGDAPRQMRRLVVCVPASAFVKRRGGRIGMQESSEEDG